MGYVGNIPGEKFTTINKQTLTGDGGTGYTLSQSVGSAQEIEVYVNNVRQEPGVAYTVSGTTLTMTGNVAAADSFYVIFQGKAVNTATVDDARDIRLRDGVKMFFGDGDDLSIVHDGSKSIINESGTGQLKVQTSRFALNNAAGDEKLIEATENAAVELYYNNTKRLETTSTGVHVVDNIELGHASDTTIARASAGVATIEGNTIVTADNARVGRNLIINGAMQVAQRGASAVTVSDGSNEGYTTVDRYYLNFNASIGGAIAVSQSTDTPSGFANSIKLDCTTANTSISGTQMIDLQHRFEAQDLQQLSFGSSDAQPITVSWYMKAVSFSDNISVTLNTRDGTKEFFAKSFTPTTSWARYTMTVPGSTSATIDNNNGEGLRLSWVVAGSSSGTHAASSDSTAFSTTRADYRNDIGNLTASTNNELYITGVQLETGSTTTDFEHRSFSDELQRCQRYFQICRSGFGGDVTNNEYYRAFYQFKTEMRTSPTSALKTDVNTAGFDGNYNFESVSSVGGAVYRQANTTAAARLFTIDSTHDAEL